MFYTVPPHQERKDCTRCVQSLTPVLESSGEVSHLLGLVQVLFPAAFPSSRPLKVFSTTNKCSLKNWSWRNSVPLLGVNFLPEGLISAQSGPHTTLSRALAVPTLGQAAAKGVSGATQYEPEMVTLLQHCPTARLLQKKIRKNGQKSRRGWRDHRTQQLNTHREPAVDQAASQPGSAVGVDLKKKNPTVLWCNRWTSLIFYFKKTAGQFGKKETGGAGGGYFMWKSDLYLAGPEFTLQCALCQKIEMLTNLTCLKEKCNLS